MPVLVLVLVLVLVPALVLVLMLMLVLARCGVHLMCSFVCDAIFPVGTQKCSVHNTRLTRIDLSGTRPLPREIKLLSDGFGRCRFPLRELSVNGRALGLESCASLLEPLRHCPLEVLELRKNEICGVKSAGREPFSTYVLKIVCELIARADGGLGDGLGLRLRRHQPALHKLRVLAGQSDALALGLLSLPAHLLLLRPRRLLGMRVEQPREPLGQLRRRACRG